MAGGLALTGVVASALQAYAEAGHRVDPGYTPDADAMTDRWGFPVAPKAETPPQKAPPYDGGAPASWHNQAHTVD